MSIRIKGFRFILLVFVAIFVRLNISAQSAPRLVVGITVDQMRWDYLHRYEDRWHEHGGIRKLIQQGFSCENTYIGYSPSYTASGHAGIYTGSVPAIHGITGNNWWDHHKQGFTYSTSDDKVKTVGSTSDAGEMSPANLLTTTICDELKLATNFRSKTIGIALKDRGAILSAGHSADAAYWYDGAEGEWITSTYYMDTLPAWVKQFNTKEKVDSLYRLDWDLLYPKATYTQSVANPKEYEARTFGSPRRQFPYNLNRLIGVDYDMITTTPQGNTLTTAFAKATILGEQMGADSISDFLALSYSSTDYIGHAFGPNSIEIEDTFLRFDLELADFLSFLDEQVGKGNYLVFLTSDHGVAHVPGFMQEHKLSGGLVNERDLQAELNEALKQEFGVPGISKNILNFQVVLNTSLINQHKKLSEPEIAAFAINWLEKKSFISRAVRLDQAELSALPQIQKTSIANGYYPARSGHIQIIYMPGYIEGFLTGGTTHGGIYAYDNHIPLIWYGWQIPPGRKSVRRMDMADIAPTVASLLNIQEPNGSIGRVIHELSDPGNGAVK